MSYRTCVIDYVKGMRVKVPVQDALAGLAGPPPPFPSPPLRVVGVGVGGGGVGVPGTAWEFCAGEGGYSGKSFWQARMAPDLGG